MITMAEVVVQEAWAVFPLVASVALGDRVGQAGREEAAELLLLCHPSQAEVDAIPWVPRRGWEGEAEDASWEELERDSEAAAADQAAWEGEAGNRRPRWKPARTGLSAAWGASGDEAEAAASCQEAWARGAWGESPEAEGAWAVEEAFQEAFPAAEAFQTELPAAWWARAGRRQTVDAAGQPERAGSAPPAASRPRIRASRPWRPS